VRGHLRPSNTELFTRLISRHWCSGRMLTVVASAVENTAWQGSNGVVTEGSGNTQNNDGIGFKGGFVMCFLGLYFFGTRLNYAHACLLSLAVYIRGLREAYRRTPSNAQLRTLLRSYIDVQVRHPCSLLNSMIENDMAIVYHVVQCTSRVGRQREFLLCQLGGTAAYGLYVLG
jgi:hypothetical protein